MLLESVSGNQREGLVCSLPKAFMLLEECKAEVGIVTRLQPLKKVLDQVKQVQRLSSMPQVQSGTGQTFEQKRIAVDYEEVDGTQVIQKIDVQRSLLCKVRVQPLKRVVATGVVFSFETA